MILNSLSRRYFLRQLSTIPAIVGGQSMLGIPSSMAQEELFSPKNFFRIFLSTRSSVKLLVLDGEVWFVGGVKSQVELHETYKQSYEKYRDKITVQSASVVWNCYGQYIRVRIPPTQKDVTPAQWSVDGHYLSADYSTIPPRVVLTPKPTEGSQWEIETVKGSTEFGNPRVGQKHVRHLNGRGINAWLARSETSFIRIYHKSVAVYQPVLSFIEKDYFDFSWYNPDEERGK